MTMVLVVIECLVPKRSKLHFRFLLLLLLVPLINLVGRCDEDEDVNDKKEMREKSFANEAIPTVIPSLPPSQRYMLSKKLTKPMCRSKISLTIDAQDCSSCVVIGL